MDTDIFIPAPNSPALGVERAIIYVDGCCKGNPGPCGVGASFRNEAGQEFHTIAADIGFGTNNQAEYKAVLRAMWDAYQFQIREITIYSDSSLVVDQVNGRAVCRHPDIRPLYETVMLFISRFRLVSIERIPREKNGRADSLANEGFYSGANLDGGGRAILHSAAAE